MPASSNLWQSQVFLLVGSRRQNLPAAVFARLQVDMVRPAALAAVLVFDIGRSLQGVMRTPLAPLHRGHFLARNCHRLAPICPRAKSCGAADHTAGTPNAILIADWPDNAGLGRCSEPRARLIRKIEGKRQSPRKIRAKKAGVRVSCDVLAGRSLSGSRAPAARASGRRGPDAASRGRALPDCAL